MPTGYTSMIIDGDGCDFKTFALQCARAFGALVEMRDDAMDAPIPDEFKPSDYNKKELDKATKELAKVQTITDKQAERQAEEQFIHDMEEWHESQKKCTEKLRRYENMMAEVRKWKPPTSEHDGLHKFMFEQIKESIDFDCGGYPQPVKLSGKDWIDKKVASALRDIEYNAKSHAEELKRCKERSEWVKALKASLGVK